MTADEVSSFESNQTATMSEAGDSSTPSLSREEQFALWRARKKKGDKREPRSHSIGLSQTPPASTSDVRRCSPATGGTHKRPSPSNRQSLSSSKNAALRPSPSTRQSLSSSKNATLRPSPSTTRQSLSSSKNAFRPLNAKCAQESTPNVAVADTHESSSKLTPSFLSETRASRQRRQSVLIPPLPTTSSRQQQRTPLQSHPVNVSSRTKKSKSFVPCAGGPTPVPARIMVHPLRSTSPLSCNSGWFILDGDNDEDAVLPRPSSLRAETPEQCREVDNTFDSTPGGTAQQVKLQSCSNQSTSQRLEQVKLQSCSSKSTGNAGGHDAKESQPFLGKEDDHVKARGIPQSLDDNEDTPKNDLNISVSDDLKSVQQECQRSEEELGWLFDDKSPTGRVSSRPSRRTDASQLLLPIPSLRGQCDDYESPTMDVAATTPVFSEEKFDWRNEISPIGVQATRRRVEEPLLLPIPSLREATESTPCASTPKELPTPTTQSLETDLANGGEYTPPEVETVEDSPLVCMETPIPTPFQQPPKVDNRTLLPCVPEGVNLSRLESLQDQVDRLLTEKQSLANQLADMRKSHEDRLNPFRDVFEELRKQTAKSTRLEGERQQVMQTVTMLQTQVKATVQMAVDRATQLEKELEAANARNANLEAELIRLRSSQQ